MSVNDKRTIRTPERVAACALDELTDGTARLFVLRQRKIALARVGDDVFAVQDACPHFNGPLSDGTVSVARKELICPWHRFRFELATGCSVTNPDLKAPTYPVSIEDGHVFVTI
jgi:nitrite reductase/ring-hydroxylating ferredoxin subunit